MAARTLALPLVGAGGEPVDFWRTVISHGLTFLPPTQVDEQDRSLEATVRIGARVRTLRLRQRGNEVVVSAGGAMGRQERERAAAVVAHMLRLDEDLSDFYTLAAADQDLSWAGLGAARLLRSQTVFEEVVKTICTTNCAWSATERMVGTLVSTLGDRSSDGDQYAFPTAEAMAAAPLAYYRDEVRCGYRGAYLRAVADLVATGAVDLEALASADPREVSDDEVERQLLTLPGVGIYAAAHIMLLIGRYSRLVLDSWTRPKYARLVGRPKTDRQIAWRFRRFGDYAGLAFWLFVTQDWATEPAGIR